MKDSMQSFIEETFKKNFGEVGQVNFSCDDFYPLYEKLFVQVQSKFKPNIMPLVFTVLSSWLFGEAMAMIDEGKRNKLMDTFFMMLERHESIWRKHNR